jgi:hypothetical protein
MPQLCTFGAAAARGFGLTEESALLPDDDFNLTTLLLPGNGTNGAQNNTFLDSSTNNFTVTRNGNTTQGTFSPFSFGGGTAPADGYYSGYFDGTGDSLSISSSTAFNFGTGNFTIQGWVYMFAYTAGGAGPALFGTTNGATTGYYINLGGDVNGLRVTSNASGSWTDNITVSTGNGVSLNQWTHIALVRNGASLILYKNGVNVASTSSASSWNFSSPNNAGYIGRVTNGVSTQELTGYISNLKVSNVAESISVPTTPLTSDGNTRLLTCQSSQFIDNSTNAFAITVNGNTRPAVVNPFGMTDWSGYFDGNGDYLSLNAGSALTTTGDFTVEAFAYVTSASTFAGIFSTRNSTNSDGVAINILNTGFLDFSVDGTGGGAYTGTAVPLNQWFHVALVRSGSSSNNCSCYLNGVRIAQFTGTSQFDGSSGTAVIGRYYTDGANQYWITGLISNLRVVIGSALYSGTTYTVPTGPLTAVANTAILTCQSSTFVDNSPNAFTITANGSAYTGTLNNPFNSPVNYTTPPLQAWSNYFGKTDTLQLAATTSLTTFTGDFCFEAWICPTDTTITDWYFWDSRQSGASSSPMVFGLAPLATPVTGRARLFYFNGSSHTGTGTVYYNQWQHVAFARSGSTMTFYVNGVAGGTASIAGTQTGTATSNPIFINTKDNALSSYGLGGYISNFRIVNGRPVYTSNFTPSTTPLTAISNTVLLTCQSNGFVDNSINSYAITRTGSTSVQPFSPFNPTEAYSAANVGGSGYFDGSGDYLTVPDNAALDLGTSDFCIEGWAYLNSTTEETIVAKWGALAGTSSYLVYVSAGTLTLLTTTNGFNVDVNLAGAAVSTGSWFHFAVVRSGSSYAIFQNGSRTATTTNSNTIYDSSTVVSVGRYTGGGFGEMNGYISGLRIVKGSSVYNSPFIPPTAPLTAITNTSLLLNYTNGGIIDATAKGDWETVGNAQISTAQSKFGGSSMYFNGSGDRLINSASSQYTLFDFGTGDFTIEFWFYCTTTTSGIVYARGASGHNLCTVYVGANATDRVSFYAAASGAGTAIKSAGTPVVSTWNHAAIVRQNGTVTVYLNGTGGTPTSNTTDITNSSYVPSIGDYNHSPLPFSGYIDDLRITKGYARYTTDFTPPTQAFPLL